MRDANEESCDPPSRLQQTGREEEVGAGRGDEGGEDMALLNPSYTADRCKWLLLLCSRVWQHLIKSEMLDARIYNSMTPLTLHVIVRN